MAKKTQLATKSEDGSGIPDFLNRSLNGVKPPGPTTGTTAAVADKPKKRDFAQPKGMSDEDWQRIQAAKANPAPKAEKPKPTPKAKAEKPKPAPKAKAEKPPKVNATRAAQAAKPVDKPAPATERMVEGKLSAHDIGRKMDVPAKVVRRALRTLKTLPKPAEGWFFAPADFDKVAAVVREFMAGARGPKAARGSKKAKTGKVAKATPASAPVASSEAATGKVKPTPMDQIAKPAPRTRAAAAKAKADDTKRSEPAAKAPKVTLAALFERRKAKAATEATGK